jgi:hypothetical protein
MTDPFNDPDHERKAAKEQADIIDSIYREAIAEIEAACNKIADAERDWPHVGPSRETEQVLQRAAKTAMEKAVREHGLDDGSMPLVAVRLPENAYKATFDILVRIGRAVGVKVAI